jgi:hypothetical protein
MWFVILLWSLRGHSQMEALLLLILDPKVALLLRGFKPRGREREIKIFHLIVYM